MGTQGFVGTFLLLDSVLRKADSLEADRIRNVAFAMDIAEGGTALGWGVKFAGESDAMRGQNLRAFPVAQQWQNGKLVVVSPEKAKTTEATLMPLPVWDKR